MTATTIPDGYVLAPKEPTREMYLAACSAFVNWQTLCNSEASRGLLYSQPDFDHNDVYREMLAAAPSIPLPAAPVQGWISVRDRLPELHQPVALLNTETWLNTGGDFNANWHGAGYLSEFGNKYWSVIGERGGMTLDAVTHWCELPLPPAGDSNG